MKLRKSEQKALDAAKALEGEHFTPTMLGIAMGYEHAQAASRVAPALRTLHGLGLVTKTVIRHNLVTYQVAEPELL